jgi:aquaporin NIP
MDNLFATAFIWEFLLTFFLMLVIMAVATDYRATGQAAGLAIGGTVWFEAMFAGPLCGASMNPARSLGPALVSGDWTHFSAYVFGPILGATAGAFFYEFIRYSHTTRGPST